MRIAVIGGGAAGLVTAYHLDKRFDVTLFEKQPILGGSIRTLNKNVRVNSDKLPHNLFVDNGVIEFDEKNFHLFHALMKDLNVEMESVPLTTGFFFADGRYILSLHRIMVMKVSFFRRLKELKKLTFCIVDFLIFMSRTAFRGETFYENKSVSVFFRDHSYYRWLKMLLMYAYSIPYNQIEAIPAAFGIPMLRSYSLFTSWTRIKGGVYTYVEKILERFSGTIRLNANIQEIGRTKDGVTITLAGGKTETFDKVVLATQPDQVLKLLANPTKDEVRYFSGWHANRAHTLIHTDTSIYAQYGIVDYSAFDLFQKEDGDAGYNAFLDTLLGLGDTVPTHYNLAYNLDELIDPALVIHEQEHHTPLYTLEALAHRSEVISNNGSNNTYHAGAYLYDGLHEGAVQSALRVVELIEKASIESQSPSLT